MCSLIDLLFCAESAVKCRQISRSVFVVVELPVMTRRLFVRMRNDSSVTVMWREWSKPPDRGQGPVSAYVVYYRGSGDTRWGALRQSTSTMAVVTGLEQDRLYEFRVAAVHQSGVVGISSRTLHVSTCGSMFIGLLVFSDQNQKSMINVHLKVFFRGAG